MIIKFQYFLQKSRESLLGLIKVFLLSRYGSGVRTMNRTKDCLLLLNGPSLNSLAEKNPGMLTENDLFCVNFFPLTPMFTKVKPGYFIISAPELWLEDVDPIFREKSRKVFQTIAKQTDWPLQLLIPFAARKSGDWKGIIESNQNINIVYYNDTGIEGFAFLIFWFYRRKLAMPRPHNVLVPSLINAINLGYKNIYLWGAENNQFLELTVDQNNNALINQKHFYDKDNSKHKTMNKLGKGKRRVHEILHKFMLSFQAYHIINDYAESRNVRIINQTPDSLIDAFERESLKANQ